MADITARHISENNPDLIADSVRIDQAYDMLPSAETISLFYNLVYEEMDELKESMELFRTSCENGTPDQAEYAHMLKETYDVTTMLISFMHMMGADIASVWNACTQNNFDKMDSTTGKFMKNEAGKIIKPANWKPVDLTPLVAADFQAMLPEFKKLEKDKA